MKRFKVVLRILVTCVCLRFLAPSPAMAHKPSDSYLRMEVAGNELSGRWDIGLRDLEVAVGLDSNADGKLSWGEVILRRKEIFDYALSKLSVSSGGALAQLTPLNMMLERHSDGMYAVLGFRSATPIDIEHLSVDYSLLFEFDPSHRGIVTVSGPESSHSTVFSPHERTVTFDMRDSDVGSSLRGFCSFVKSGVWHILIGFDHVLFLLTLLMPAALVWSGREHGWQESANIRSAVGDVVKVVTSFTIAHSVTLALVVTGTITLPSRLVESVIALSVALSALNNVYPIVTRCRWGIAFIFGLVHGCGFASVLVDAGLPRANFFGALIGFNLGVEIGQLSIVAAALPVLFLLRTSPVYRRVGLAAGSYAASAIAVMWILERAFDVAIF